MPTEQDLEGPPIAWDIRREGRRWTGKELEARFARLMELKFEVSGGKLFWSEETRRAVLAMLLENVGIDAAVRMGDPEAWRSAVEAMLAEKR